MHFHFSDGAQAAQVFLAKNYLLMQLSYHQIHKVGTIWDYHGLNFAQNKFAHSKLLPNMASETPKVVQWDSIFQFCKSPISVY